MLNIKGEFQKLKNKFDETYLIKDPYVLKALFAGLISHEFKGIDPVWFIIVAPSGSLKTEFINAISSCRGVFPLSTLTANTLAS